jgi:hypothetical protein
LIRMASAKAICSAFAPSIRRLFSIAPNVVLQPGGQVLGVDHGNDAVELRPHAHFLVDKEGLRDGGRVCEAGRLDQDAVGFSGHGRWNTF